MARGLSKLQQNILRMALANREVKATDQEHSPMDLYFCEILHGHWGWQPVCRWSGSPMPIDKVAKYLRRAYGDKKFDKSAIGPKQYASAMASLSRAISRLEQRGLVEVRSGRYSHWTGIKLTDEGLIVARSVLANRETTTNIDPVPANGST